MNSMNTELLGYFFFSFDMMNEVFKVFFSVMSAIDLSLLRKYILEDVN